MPNIKINDKDYDLDKASDAAKAQLFHLQAIEVEVNRMNTLIAIMQTSKAAYVKALQQELDNPTPAAQPANS